jgi:hypothetical protein
MTPKSVISILAFAFATCFSIGYLVARHEIKSGKALDDTTLDNLTVEVSHQEQAAGDPVRQGHTQNYVPAWQAPFSGWSSESTSQIWNQSTSHKEEPPASRPLTRPQQKAFLVYSCPVPQSSTPKKLFKWNIDTMEPISIQSDAVADARDRSRKDYRLPLNAERSLLILGPFAGLWTLKDILWSKGEVEERIIEAAALVLGGLSGFLVGYEIAISQGPGCDSDAILVRLAPPGPPKTLKRDALERAVKVARALIKHTELSGDEAENYLSRLTAELNKAEKGDDLTSEDFAIVSDIHRDAERIGQVHRDLEELGRTGKLP